MAAKHIEIARERGPKAGFDAYMSGRGQHLGRQSEIRATGGRRAQFSAYCSIFGDQFGNGGVNHVAATEHAEEEKQSVIEKLAALLSRQTETEDEVGVVAVEEEEVDPIQAALSVLLDAGVDVSALNTTKGTTKPKARAKAQSAANEVPQATRVSFPMAMVLKRYATRDGRKFEIVSKTGKGAGANYGVKLDGVKLTPKAASDLIAAYKGRK